MTEITKFIAELRTTADAVETGSGGVTVFDAAALLRTAADLFEHVSTPKDGLANGEIPYKIIVELYNSILGKTLQPALKMPAMRRVNIAQRWKQDSERQSIEWWTNYWKRVAASDFLTGRAPPRPGHEHWRPNFDWLVKDSNMTKVVEGNYDNRGPRLTTDSITRFR